MSGTEWIVSEVADVPALEAPTAVQAATEALAEIDRKVNEAMAERERKRETLRAELLSCCQDNPDTSLALLRVEQALLALQPPVERVRAIWNDDRGNLRPRMWASALLTTEINCELGALLYDIGIVLEASTRTSSDQIN